MQISSLFSKPIDRPIEGVIKADDFDSIKIEVEEYVITNVIAKHLTTLITAYNSNNQSSNGVWISGFFGSGKSHLLKMLALLLENNPELGISVLDTFLQKLPASEAMLKADMQRAARIPSRSILFNIDQKADAIAKTDFDALLGVFSKVFDEFCGYYGQQGYIAQLERDLDENNLFADFKQAFQEIAGESWHQGREHYNLRRGQIAQAYARVTGNSENVSSDIVRSYREDYSLSIEDFAERVNKYIQKQEKGFRLNFFVDEVGQYIAENIKLMTNLQTIVESLATRCKGQAWLFVTSQGDMDAVLGQFGKQQAQDFSKIMGRFQTKINLSSQDVAEVIQKRLLDKSSDGTYEMKRLYARDAKNLEAMFNFPDNGMSFKGFRDEEHFVASYPFIPYQYILFQQAIQGLSDHNFFTGKFQSVGQRSMLGVFQDVVKDIGAKEVGSLAAFDQMYEGIRNTIKANAQGLINIAEQQIDNPFYIRVLKALFLVKYIRTFRATARNLRILLQSAIHEDTNTLQMEIGEALSYLERKTYIQRNGEVYEFLTNEEQDIENKIKQETNDRDEVTKYLADIFFSEIIKDNKLTFADSQQAYSFSKRIDGALQGQPHELVIEFITPFSEFSGDIAMLTAHSMARPEMLVVLPSDDIFLRDVSLYLQTDKYIKQNLGKSGKEAVNMILNNKAYQNQERRKLISQRAKEMVSNADFLLMGDISKISGEDPRTRIMHAFQVLVKKAYPNLGMLQGVVYNENDIRGYLDPPGGALITSDQVPMNQAEEDMYNFISLNKQMGQLVTMKKLTDRYESKPYGWYLAAIQCVTAMLAGRRKIEAWSDGNLLDNGPLEKALRNTYGFSNLIFSPVEAVDAAVIMRLKEFYRQFFNEPAAESDPRQLVKNIKEQMKHLKATCETHLQQQHHYPFLLILKPAISSMEDFIKKDYEFFIKSFSDEDVQQWMELKATSLDPVRTFMAGPKKDIYDSLRDFLTQNKPDLSNDEIDILGDILQDKMVFAGSRLQEARVTLEKMKDKHHRMVEEARQEALENLKALQEQMHVLADFKDLKEEQQRQVDERFQQIEYTIQQQPLVGSIRDKAAVYKTSYHPALIDQVSAMAAKNRVDKGEKPQIEWTTIHLSTLLSVGSKPLLESEEDIKAYIAALQSAMLEAIRNHKRIQR